MKILHCYYTHFIFITHVVRRSSIFLSRCVNFCILIHKFAHRCAHCHHPHFIFTTKQPILISFITHIVAKNILHAHYVAKLRTFLLDVANFLSITNSPSAFFITALQCIIIFCHVCSIRLLLQSLKNYFLQQYTFHHSFCMRKYRNICTTHQLERTKIIFYYRIIINNVVFTRFFVNHFAKMPHLLQKLLVALHYTLLLSHFLLFRFQFISH